MEVFEMMTAKVFQSGNSQAIRIPKEVQTDLREFYIKKVGEGYILYPVDDPWFPLKLSIGQMPEDYMCERDQPAWEQATQREEL